MRIISHPLFQRFEGFVEDAQQRQALEDLLRTAERAPGRQGTGYFKYDLKPVIYTQMGNESGLRPVVDLMLHHLGVKTENDPWDCLLLLYPPGSYVPSHRDDCPAFGNRHVRMNLMLRRSPHGGVFYLDFGGDLHPVRLDAGDAILFHPDETDHAVTRCDGGPRVILTVGAWVPKETVQ